MIPERFAKALAAYDQREGPLVLYARYRMGTVEMLFLNDGEGPPLHLLRARRRRPEFSGVLPTYELCGRLLSAASEAAMDVKTAFMLQFHCDDEQGVIECRAVPENGTTVTATRNGVRMSYVEKQTFPISVSCPSCGLGIDYPDEHIHRSVPENTTPAGYFGFCPSPICARVVPIATGRVPLATQIRLTEKAAREAESQR